MATEKQRERGEGRVYDRGGVWWIEYWQHGRQYRASSRSRDRREAVKVLRTRLSEITSGRHCPDASKVHFADLEQLLRDEYELNGRRSLKRAGQALTHLREAFGGERALDITVDRLNRYATQRREDKAALATVQYELAILRRAFTLATRAGRLTHQPAFPVLQVRNARQGFFEGPELAALLAELPDALRPVIQFAHLTGWRIPSEVLTLTWRQVDFQAGIVRLEVHTTKNDEGRTFPFSALPALEGVLTRQRETTSALEEQGGPVVPWVFHRGGRPIRDYREAWTRACARAGCPGMIPHDLRRTAVRNLERAGVSRSVAMKLTGHKTESVFRRYAIVAEQDLREGVAKLANLGVERTRTEPAQSEEIGRRGSSEGDAVSLTEGR